MDGTRRWSIFAAILTGLLAAVVPGGCTSNVNAPPNPAAPIVRVLLLSECQRIVIAGTSAPTVFSVNAGHDSGAAGGGEASRLNFARNVEIPISLSSSGWQVGSASFPPGELHLVPGEIASLSVGRDDGSEPKTYRGSYRLVPVGGDRFDVVDDVDIDSYLKGVVASEMPRQFLPEAYKAQAIAARTFALYEARTSGKGRGFDLYSDVRSQVYGGVAAESAMSREAVDETAGIVLTIGTPAGPQLFKAYFSSCCGGIGQSSADAFGDPYQSTLVAQNVGSLCSESPRFNWPTVTIRKDELTRRIRAWGAKRSVPIKDMAELTRIDILSVNRYGRPAKFVVTDARGWKYSLGGEELRNAYNFETSGGPILLSSFFRPISDGDVISFTDGHGWGHGVGLCQWCAQARAEQGMRHEQILQLSYPTSQRIRAY